MVAFVAAGFTLLLELEVESVLDRSTKAADKADETFDFGVGFDLNNGFFDTLNMVGVVGVLTDVVAIVVVAVLEVLTVVVRL
jgi:hypothetical protein